LNEKKIETHRNKTDDRCQRLSNLKTKEMQ